MNSLDLTMTIDGKAVATAHHFDVINPAKGAAFSRAPECSAEQLDAAFASSQRVFRAWSSDEAARRATMHTAADALVAAVADIAPVLTAEQGKPLNQAAVEVYAAAMWLRYYADLELAPEVIQDNEQAHVEVVRRPLGVVAAITPWNFPLVLAFWKIAPAMRAGNTIVLKPSPYTPLASLKVGEVLRGVLPDGVLNVVTGSDPLGAAMTSHPVPRKVSFTGSVETGKRVAAAVASDLKRVTLELGGNDPAIVLDDADVATVAEKIFTHAFANNGQVCSAIKRVYVPEAMYADVAEALAVHARNARVGDGMVEGTQFGPINNRPQLERVAMLVADAIDHGAVPLTGGERMEGDGYFYSPTILVGATDGMRIVDEEQFGPALPVVPYRNVDDVVERVNSGHFGLGGSVWGADTDRAAAIADQLDCGTSWVNTHLVLQAHQPFGGAKWSGLGVENGPWGLHGFTDIKVQYRAK